MYGAILKEQHYPQSRYDKQRQSLQNGFCNLGQSIPNLRLQGGKYHEDVQYNVNLEPGFEEGPADNSG
jgi:hypothetical protein